MDTSQIGKQIIDNSPVNVPVPEVTQADAARTQAAVTSLIGASVKILHKYFGRIPSFKYLFADGVAAIFRPDMFNPTISTYYTDNPKYIAELNKEIDTFHPYIYVDPNQLTVEERMLDPVAAYEDVIRRKLMLELEQQGRLRATGMDAGSYASPQLRPASSNDISAITGQDTRIQPQVPMTSVRPDQQPGISVTPAAVKMLAVAGLRANGG